MFRMYMYYQYSVTTRECFNFTMKKFTNFHKALWEEYMILIHVYLFIIYIEFKPGPLPLCTPISSNYLKDPKCVLKPSTMSLAKAPENKLFRINKKDGLPVACLSEGSPDLSSSPPFWTLYPSNISHGQKFMLTLSSPWPTSLSTSQKQFMVTIASMHPIILC